MADEQGSVDTFREKAGAEIDAAIEDQKKRDADMCEGCLGPRTISVARAECFSCFRGSAPEVQEAFRKAPDPMTQQPGAYDEPVAFAENEHLDTPRAQGGATDEEIDAECDRRAIDGAKEAAYAEREEEQVDFAKYVRPLRVPAENCQEEVMVLVRKHVVTSTGLFLPERYACNDSNLTRHEVVRLPAGENPDELGFNIGDFVFIAVPSGFQKPQCAQPLDTDEDLLLFSNKFIIAVDERPFELHRRPGDILKDE